MHVISMCLSAFCEWFLAEHVNGYTLDSRVLGESSGRSTDVTAGEKDPRKNQIKRTKWNDKALTHKMTTTQNVGEKFGLFLGRRVQFL